MNPSPMGGFMEGIAGGITGGMKNYVQQKREKDEEKRAKATRLNSRDFAIFTNKDLPKEMRMRHYGAYDKRMKNIDPNYMGYELNESSFENKSLQNYMDKWNKILGNEKLSQEEENEAISALSNEMMADPSVDVRRGQSIIRQRIDQIKQKRTGLAADKLKKDMEKVFAPMAEKGVDPGQPSALMSGLTEAYGQKAAGGIGAATQAGIPMHQAAGMFPKKKPAPEPTIPMHITMDVEGGTQKMRWNPKTRKHDIPIGKTKKVGAGHFFKLSGNYYETKNGEAKLIKQGSLRERATMNAMREFGWSMMAEPEQIALVDRHERLLAGKPATSGPAPGKTGRKLTKEMAMTLLEAAKGNKDLARKMAKEQGYSF